MRLSVALLLVLCACCAAAQPGRQAILIVIPGLRVEDFARQDLPQLRNLVSQSAVGFMNVRTARVPGQTREPIEAVYLTLGSGARAAAGDFAANLDETALNRMNGENASLDHPVSIGALGDMLQVAGIRTALIGSENDTRARAPQLLLAMRSDGRVDERLGERSVHSPARPFGLADDLPPPHAARAAFQVWVCGEVARAVRYAQFCLPAAAAHHRTAALRRVNDLVEQIQREALKTDTLLIILCPPAADFVPPLDRLTPFLMRGAGMEAGWITSSSTRRAGVALATDFLPTVARFYGLSAPSGMIGRPITALTGSSRPTPESWSAMHEGLVRTARLQAAFGGLPTLQLVLVLAGIVCWLAVRRMARPAPAVLRAIPIAILVIPAGHLFLPLLNPDSGWMAAALMGLAHVIAGAAAIYSARASRILALVLCFGLPAVVGLDLLLGGILLQRAWMSYSVTEGARFYGIGNEYAGAALGSIFAGVFLSGRFGWGSALAAGALAVLMGMPAFGANVGGMLSLTIAVFVAAAVWRRGSLRARDVGSGLLAAAALLAFALLVDSLRGQESTHLARAIASGEVFGIAARKLELNLYLLLHSPWTPCLIAAGIGLWLLWQPTESALRARLIGSAPARAAAAGLLGGCAALLVLNDSGVVACAIALLAGWAAAALTVLDGG